MSISHTTKSLFSKEVITNDKHSFSSFNMFLKSEHSDAKSVRKVRLNSKTGKL